MKNETCKKLLEWVQLMHGACRTRNNNDLSGALSEVTLAVEKSCLLDRTIYKGENPSKTPCPVHKGIWQGIHLGWPGRKWSDGTPVKEERMLREWYDAGCRCFMHKCGCTTGWQPDEHCGCGEKE